MPFTKKIATAFSAEAVNWAQAGLISQAVTFLKCLALID
jgi:hypothetical protein